MVMHTLFSITLSPALRTLLAISGLAAMALIMILFSNLVARQMSGWSAIARRFPMTAIHDAGDTYKKRNGIIGGIGLGRRGFLNIRLAQEGVCLYPSFARHVPCLIPWSAIRRVSVSEPNLALTVEYERSFEFFLPAGALSSLKGKLSPELFHKAGAPFEAATAALKAGGQPRWVSAIASRAIQSVEKEAERRKHDGTV